MSASLRTLITAFVLAALTFGVLVHTEPSVGIVRDEGIYMAASRRYGRWASDVARGEISVSDRAARDRAFRVNAEHPAFMKIVAGLSGSLASEATRGQAQMDPGDPLRESTAYRIPAMFLTSLGVGLLYLVGAQLGSSITGLFTAIGFLSLPRVFFHAHLHCFDVPVAIWILAAACCWFRAGTSRIAGVGVGVVLGLGIATKHNALFMIPLFLGHELLTWCLRWRRCRRRPPWRALLSLRVGSVLAISPLIVLATWPWIWADTVPRILEYFDFHRGHAYYNMEFLGRNYNEPPMPISYPFVMTFATVPWSWIALAVVGGWMMVGDDLRALADRDTACGDSAKREGADLKRVSAAPPLLGTGMVVLSLFPILLIALPSIPIFGGTKHWITAYPFVLLLAGVGLHRLGGRALQGIRRSRRTAVLLACAACILAPALLSTRSSHPFETAQYNGIVGGARGGASAGLNRGYWGHTIDGIFDEDDSAVPLFLHDLHPLAARQYRRDRRWPKARSGVKLRESQEALLFYEQHMTADEVRIWNDYGTTRPHVVVTVEDVPVTSLYRRPTPSRARP